MGGENIADRAGNIFCITCGSMNSMHTPFNLFRPIFAHQDGFNEYFNLPAIPLLKLFSILLRTLVQLRLK